MRALLAPACAALLAVACGSARGGGDGEASPDSAAPAVEAGPGQPGADGGREGSPSGGADAGAVPEAGPGPSGDAGLGTSSVTLDFIGSAYTMYVSVAGGPPHVVQADTGSLGMFVPKSVVGSSATPSSSTCSITYVSSGVTLSGHEVTAAVALLGSSKSGDVTPPPSTVPMTVCAVDDTTFSGGMMGVGFGRGSTPDPTRNVLLQMADVHGGTMRPGYILSTHPSPAITIGVTAADSAGFQTIALAPNGGGDWLATSLRGCLSVPAAPSFGQPCGPMLVDTGVADTLLWGPKDPTLGGVVPSGQTTVPSGVAFQIAAPANASILDWSFTLGSGSDSPAGVGIRSATAFSINTGRALLVDYDYLFDAEGGLVGFRRAP